MRLLTNAPLDIERAIREPKDEPLRLKDYATADLPDAASWGFGLVYDLTAGTVKFSNGTSWNAFQPLDTDLTAIAGLTSAANKVPYATGAGTWALADFTAYGRSVVATADAAALRTLAALGTAAVKNTGTSGDAVPVLNGATPTFSDGIVANGVITTATGFNFGLLQVVGTRIGGWSADTGTAKRTANATYSATANAAYSQSQIQALMDAVRDATQTIKALKDDILTHGLIGA